MDAGEFEKLFSENMNYDNVEVKKGEMSPLERFNAIMDFKEYDRMIDTEFGYWDDTLKRWHNEGLPKYVDNNEKADLYFGFDVWRKSIPANTTLEPKFEKVILEDDGHKQIIIDPDGIKCEIFSNGADTIPHYIDFPVKDAETYKPIKEKLQIQLDKRIKVNLAEIGKKVKNRNYVLQAAGGSTAGMIRNWMGFEGICINIFDQPELLEEILEDLRIMLTALAKEVTKHMQVDLVAWWEDIAFKNGPIVTPDFFIDKCGPVIKDVMNVYRENGTKYGYVDCDGDFKLLLPGWKNNGVNIMFPLEVAAGIHPEELRKNNPGQRMMGGFDKMALLYGKNAIKKELYKVKFLADQGGFIPHVDHRVQADVSYENYLYYLDVKRNLFGLPGKVAEE